MSNTVTSLLAAFSLTANAAVVNTETELPYYFMPADQKQVK